MTEIRTGDRVRVTDRANQGVGLTGVVTRLSTNGYPSFILMAEVRFDCGQVNGWPHRRYPVSKIERIT